MKIKLRYRLKENIILLTLLFLFLLLFGVFREQNNLLESLSFSRAFYDREGALLRLTLSADEKYRLFTPHTELPSGFREALLLKEDRFFSYHPGVNLISLSRAFIQTYVLKQRRIGGSTITMQTARIFFKLNTKSISGKLFQVLTALYLELFYTKKHILSVYINLAPCGGNVEGFPAAALVYFGKPLKELSFSQWLLLTVIPQDPADRAPRRDRENSELLEARMRLFKEWVAIHPEDREAENQLHLWPEIQEHLPFRTPHYVDSLLKRDIRDYSVYTTIHSQIQELVERHTSLYLKRRSSWGINNAAVMVMDYTTMELLAVLGSGNFFDDKIQGQVNGTEAYRSPGSTLKPFIFARAIDMGLIHPKTMLRDAPTSFSEYTPDNYQGDFKGPVFADLALVGSRNIPAIELASRISNPDLYEMLKRIKVPLKPRGHYGLSIVLGSAEVRMKDLMMLYGALGNKGKVFPVKELLYENTVSPWTKLFSPEAAFLTLNMLAENPPPGENLKTFTLKRDEPVAYKTGTSIGFKDCWSVGIFDNLVMAVWIGNFNGYGNDVFIGRKTAVPLMFELIDSLRRNGYSVSTPALFSPGPYNVTPVSVCAVSGRIKGDYCPKSISTLFIPGVSPIEKCKIHRLLYIDQESGFRVEPGTPGSREEVWEVWPSDLLLLFKEAGLPRRQPPPYDPGIGVDHLTAEGYAPRIMSPLTSLAYVIRLSEVGRREIPLQAVADGDVKQLYWFVNKSFIGSAAPKEPLEWLPEPGEHLITVIDERGRKDSRTVKVRVEQ